MAPDQFFFLLISAILLAGLYATMSYGLALIYGVMRIVNLSHSGFMMMGAYTAYVLITPTFGIKLNPFLAPFFVVPLFFVFGMALQRYVVRGVMNAPMITSLLLLFGVWLIIQNIAYIIFTGDTRTITTEFTLQTFKLGTIPISVNRLLVFLVSIVVLVMLRQFMARTLLGKAIRATARDADAAALVGIDTARAQMIAFGMGTALAALAGALMSLTFAFDPEFGRSHLLKSFSIVVMGGMESFVGVAMGSLLLALIEIFAIQPPFNFPPALQDFVSFALLVIVLVVAPNGLMAALKRKT